MTEKDLNMKPETPTPTDLEKQIEEFVDELRYILAPEAQGYKYDFDRRDAAVAKTKALLQTICLTVLGVDDTEVRGSTQNPDNPKYWTKKTAHRNELRQEQRQALNNLIEGSNNETI